MTVNPSLAHACSAHLPSHALHTALPSNCACVLSSFCRVQLCATLWTVVPQAPLPVGILHAKILEWVACPPPGDIPDPGFESVSLISPALAGRFFFFFFTTSTTWKPVLQPTPKNSAPLPILHGCQPPLTGPELCNNHPQPSFPHPADESCPKTAWEFRISITRQGSKKSRTMASALHCVSHKQTLK